MVSSSHVHAVSLSLSPLFALSTLSLSTLSPLSHPHTHAMKHSRTFYHTHTPMVTHSRNFYHTHTHGEPFPHTHPPRTHACTRTHPRVHPRHTPLERQTRTFVGGAWSSSSQWPSNGCKIEVLKNGEGGSSSIGKTSFTFSLSKR